MQLLFEFLKEYFKYWPVLNSSSEHAKVNERAHLKLKGHKLKFAGAVKILVLNSSDEFKLKRNVASLEKWIITLR